MIEDRTPTLLRLPYSGIYTVRDAALYLRATTPPRVIPLKQWEAKRTDFVGASSRSIYRWIREGLLWDELKDMPRRDLVLSFEDLIRLRMMVILRSRGVPLSAIHESEVVARRLTGSPQPFVTEALWTISSDVFIEVADTLVAASKSGQIAMEFLREYLVPVHHGLRFGPDERADSWSPAPHVLIDPEIQFGASCVEGTRIPTEILGSLSKAGESVESLAEMYDIEPAKVEAALAWEEVLVRAA